MAYTLPYNLVDSLQNVKGFDKAAFEAIHTSTERVTSIRVNPDKLQNVESTGYETISIPWCDDGYYLNDRPVFTFNPLIHAGGFYVQEASSMFLWHILKSIGIDSNAKVLDLCAAPGGKSTMLSTFFKDGIVVCNEVIQSRAAILVENIVKWGNDNTIVTNNDPRQFSECIELFDVIVLDAPCSGSGMFRKDNNAILEWSEESVLHCSLRQQRILTDILPCLKPGGFIIYSTCSYSKAEDEEIADYVIQQNSKLSTIQIPLEDNWNIVESCSDNYNAYGYRFFPDKLKGEGFFVAVFQNEGNSFSFDFVLKEDKKVIVSSSEKEIVNNFILCPSDYEFFKKRDSILGLPGKHINFIRLLISKLYIKRVGIELGIIKGKDFIPSHHLAMSNLAKSYSQKVTVDEETALNFLRKNDFNITADKGWNIVQYKNLPLGWIKALPNRINNYYPSEWRILKQQPQ